MNKFLEEFKEFALKGNVMDMAIGVVIGGAFKSVGDSLVNNIINPIIGCFSVGGLNGLSFKLGKAQLYYGAFIMEIINFLVIAFVLFTIIKAFNKVSDFRKAPEEAPAATTKVCPYCKSEIHVDATKCPHCASDLSE